MKTTFNDVEFTEVIVSVDGDSLEGVLIHCINDVTHEGDIICFDCIVPENADEASELIEMICANEIANAYVTSTMKIEEE